MKALEGEGSLGRGWEWGTCLARVTGFNRAIWNVGEGEAP